MQINILLRSTFCLIYSKEYLIKIKSFPERMVHFEIKKVTSEYDLD